MSYEEISDKFFDTIQETQRNYWQRKRHPLVAGLELTPYCNMKCVHCYLNDYPHETVLTTKDWKKIIDILYDEGVLILYMTGGEIFTRKDFIELYVYAKKKGFIIELLTNITCLNDEILEILKKYPPATVSTSVYGMSQNTYEAVTQTPGSFEKFVQAIEKLVKADIDFELKFVGLKENIDDFFVAQEFAKKLGVNFKFNFEIFPTLQGDGSILKHRVSNEDIIKIEKTNEKAVKALASNVNRENPFKEAKEVPMFTCNVAETLCFIDCFGYMSPCHKMRLKEHNLLKEGFQESWKDYIEKYAYMKAPKHFKCAKCPKIHICSPCAVINELSTGDFAVPCKEYCELTMLRAKEYAKKKYDKYRK